MIMLKHIKQVEGSVQHALPSLPLATCCQATWLTLTDTKPTSKKQEEAANYLEFCNELLHYALNAHCTQAVL